MRFQVGLLFGLLLWPIAPSASQLDNEYSYKGLCEASAATYIDNNHFVVASDETNVLRLYRKNDPSSGVALDLTTESGFDKSDIEGVARNGSTVYWISSHSLNSSGEEKKKRKIFLATTIVPKDGSPTLAWAGEFLGLRDAILDVTGSNKSDLNVEGLAVGANGGLLIGLRNTVDGKAIEVPFDNPAEVINNPDTKPALGKPFELDLHGHGIRSIERIGSHYLIVAGPASDEGAFSLYKWTGSHQAAEEVSGSFFGSLRPEALMVVPDSNAVQVLSDDGSSDCDDEASPVQQRAFRSIDMKIDR